MKMLKVLGLLGLVVATLAQTELPTDATSTGSDEETGGRRGSRNLKLNCTNVECDQAVLTECEKPVLFLGDECCPVCPMTDVCDTVECGEGEVCSEQNGEAVCCTDKTAELKRKKAALLKNLRQRFGFERCSARKEARAGVNRGPCRNNTSCDEDEVCVAAFRRAFCCPRPEAELPPCEGAAAVQTTFLGRCHAPDETLPSRPRPQRPSDDCRCRMVRRGRKSNRRQPAAADNEEEEEEEPTDATSTEETVTSVTRGQGRRGQNGRRQGGKKNSGNGPTGRPSGRGSGRQSPPGRGSGRQSPPGRGSSGRRPNRRPNNRRPFKLQCKCGFSKIKRFLRTLHKTRKQISQCRQAPQQ